MSHFVFRRRGFLLALGFTRRGLSRRRVAHCGFTLQELLVTMAILAVLLALLLPAVHTARRQAATLRCLGNLRSIGLGMIQYAVEYRGQLPGSPSTSGRHLWRLSGGAYQTNPAYNENNVPGAAIELFDFIGPLSVSMGLSLPETHDGQERLRAYQKLSLFQCPAAADIQMTPDWGEPLAAGPIISYATGGCFMLLPWTDWHNTSFADRVNLPTGGGAPSGSPSGTYWRSPPGYQPRLSRVGPASRKIFCADAARSCRYNAPPVFRYQVDSPMQQTLFSDLGAFCGITRSYDRSEANAMSRAKIDGRIFAFRHGKIGARLSAEQYRINVVYYDGHAETLSDLEAADPEKWMPTGSVIDRPTVKFNGADYVFWPDVAEKYLAGVDQAHPKRVQ